MWGAAYNIGEAGIIRNVTETAMCMCICRHHEIFDLLYITFDLDL